MQKESVIIIEKDDICIEIKKYDMRTNEIIEEISRLPISKRLYIVEKAMSAIRLENEKNDMEAASELLMSEYEENKELTIFTELDLDEFYEAR